MLDKMRLLTPGPTPIPETVRLAMAKDMIHHRKDGFRQIMFSVQEKLKQLFVSDGPVLPLACSGTGAMTAAVYSLFRPGETVLVVEAGKFGERWSEIAKSRGLTVQSLEIEWGKAVEPAAVEQIIRSNPQISGVLLQVCETSTGVLQPVEQIGKLLAGSNVLLVADGISAVGISPCPMDEWNIDCLLTGSQKGLMLPPGLALIALSPRAWEKAGSMEPGCFYFNLPKERANIEKGQTLFTTPVNLIYGLDASLDLLLKNGLSAVYEKQWQLTMLVRAGVRSIGLDFLAEDDFSWGVTSIKMPEGVDGAAVLACALQKYGVCMAGGQDALKGRIVRLGHMGWVDWGDCLAGLYALDRSLLAVGGYSASRDYMEVAMSAWAAAKDSGPGVLPKVAQIRA